MDDEKDRSRANLAQGDVAVFFFMGKVPNGNRVGVVEHQFSRLKIDAMLGEILLVLPLVALETHVACRYGKLTICTYRCQYISRVGHFNGEV